METSELLQEGGTLMHATQLWVTDPYEVTLQTFELPSAPPDGHVLIETERSLISTGTELAIVMGTHNGFTTGAAWPRYPLAPGYTAAGRILQVGAGVSGLAPGNRVITDTPHASHSVVEASRVLQVPEDFDLDAALLAHLASIPLFGLRQAHLQLGEGLVVFGLGLIGTLAARIGWLSGCRPVLGIDPIEERRRLAAAARIIPVDPGTDDVAETHRRLADGRLPEVVVEATGAPAVLPVALRVAGPMARVVLLGSPRGRVEIDPYTDIHRKGVTVIGVHDSFTPATATPQTPFSVDRERQLALALIAEGSLSIDGLITHHITPAEARTTYRALADRARGYMGVIIDWNRS